MTLTPPPWLVQHGGSLKQGSDQKTWFVVIGDAPIYSLAPVPVAGKFGCVIRQTNNGRRFPFDGNFVNENEALQKGLEHLGKELGWI